MSERDIEKARVLMQRMGLAYDDHRVDMFAEALADARADVWREVLALANERGLVSERLLAQEPKDAFFGDMVRFALRDVLRAAKAGAKGGGDG